MSENIIESTATDLDIIGSSSVAADIEALKSGHVAVYSSFKGDSHGDRMAIVKAMTNSTPVDDMLGKSIELANFVIQSVDMADEQTGELREAPRVILVDTAGKSYHAISGGILSSLKNLVGILGEPSTWPEAVTVVPTREKTRKGFNVFTLKIK